MIIIFLLTALPGRKADERFHILIVCGPILGNSGRERLCKSAIAQHPCLVGMTKWLVKGSDIEKEKINA